VVLPSPIHPWFSCDPRATLQDRYKRKCIPRFHADYYDGHGPCWKSAFMKVRALYLLSMSVVVAALAAACSSATGTGAACQPGDREACTCSDGSHGYAACTGGSFGACACTGGGSDAASGDDGSSSDAIVGDGPGTHEASTVHSDAGFGDYMGPCNQDSDCHPPADQCHNYPSKGMRCTKSCQSNADCPAPSPGCSPRLVCSVP
jgi:hypothetical protein